MLHKVEVEKYQKNEGMEPKRAMPGCGWAGDRSKVDAVKSNIA